jgi:hypothetical protein
MKHGDGDWKSKEGRVTQALRFRLGRRYGNGDSQLEARSRPTGGAMTSRSSTAAAGGPAPRCGGGLPPRCGGGLPPGARTLGATASHGLGAVAVARRSACVPATGRCACLPVREAGVGLLCWSRVGSWEARASPAGPLFTLFQI